MNSQSPERAILISFRSLTDCTVRLVTGSDAQAVMDTTALRKRHGPIYNINIGASVEIENDTPLRIVAIEHAA
jgi:hypothetical protein